MLVTFLLHFVGDQVIYYSGKIVGGIRKTHQDQQNIAASVSIAQDFIQDQEDLHLQQQIFLMYDEAFLSSQLNHPYDRQIANHIQDLILHENLQVQQMDIVIEGVQYHFVGLDSINNTVPMLNLFCYVRYINLQYQFLLPNCICNNGINIKGNQVCKQCGGSWKKMIRQYSVIGQISCFHTTLNVRTTPVKLIFSDLYFPNGYQQSIHVAAILSICELGYSFSKYNVRLNNKLYDRFTTFQTLMKNQDLETLDFEEIHLESKIPMVKLHFKMSYKEGDQYKDYDFYQNFLYDQPIAQVVTGKALFEDHGLPIPYFIEQGQIFNAIEPWQFYISGTFIHPNTKAGYIYDYDTIHLVPRLVGGVNTKCPGCGCQMPDIIQKESRVPLDWDFNYVKGRYTQYFNEPGYSVFVNNNSELLEVLDTTKDEVTKNVHDFSVLFEKNTHHATSKTVLKQYFMLYHYLKGIDYHKGDDLLMANYLKFDQALNIISVSKIILLDCEFFINGQITSLLAIGLYKDGLYHQFYSESLISYYDRPRILSELPTHTLEEFDDYIDGDELVLSKGSSNDKDLLNKYYPKMRLMQFLDISTQVPIKDFQTFSLPILNFSPQQLHTLKHVTSKNLYSKHNLQHDIQMFTSHLLLSDKKYDPQYTLICFRSEYDALHYKCSICRFSNDPQFLNHEPSQVNLFVKVHKTLYLLMQDIQYVMGKSKVKEQYVVKEKRQQSSVFVRDPNINYDDIVVKEKLNQHYITKIQSVKSIKYSVNGMILGYNVMQSGYDDIICVYVFILSLFGFLLPQDFSQRDDLLLAMDEGIQDFCRLLKFSDPTSPISKYLWRIFSSFQAWRTSNIEDQLCKVSKSDLMDFIKTLKIKHISDIDKSQLWAPYYNIVKLTDKFYHIVLYLPDIIVTRKQMNDFTLNHFIYFNGENKDFSLKTCPLIVDINNEAKSLCTVGEKPDAIFCMNLMQIIPWNRVIVQTILEGNNYVKLYCYSNFSLVYDDSFEEWVIQLCRDPIGDWPPSYLYYSQDEDHELLPSPISFKLLNNTVYMQQPKIGNWTKAPEQYFQYEEKIIVPQDMYKIIKQKFDKNNELKEIVKLTLSSDKKVKVQQKAETIQPAKIDIQMNKSSISYGDVPPECKSLTNSYIDSSILPKKKEIVNQIDVQVDNKVVIQEVKKEPIIENVDPVPLVPQQDELVILNDNQPMKRLLNFKAFIAVTIILAYSTVLIVVLSKYLVHMTLGDVLQLPFISPYIQFYHYYSQPVPGQLCNSSRVEAGYKYLYKHYLEDVQHVYDHSYNLPMDLKLKPGQVFLNYSKDPEDLFYTQLYDKRRFQRHLPHYGEFFIWRNNETNFTNKSNQIWYDVLPQYTSTSYLQGKIKINQSYDSSMSQDLFQPQWKSIYTRDYYTPSFFKSKNTWTDQDLSVNQYYYQFMFFKKYIGYRNESWYQYFHTELLKINNGTYRSVQNSFNGTDVIYKYMQMKYPDVQDVYFAPVCETLILDYMVYFQSILVTFIIIYFIRQQKTIFTNDYIGQKIVLNLQHIIPTPVCTGDLIIEFHKDSAIVCDHGVSMKYKMLPAWSLLDKSQVYYKGRKYGITILNRYSGTLALAQLISPIGTQFSVDQSFLMCYELAYQYAETSKMRQLISLNNTQIYKMQNLIRAEIEKNGSTKLFLPSDYQQISKYALEATRINGLINTVVYDGDITFTLPSNMLAFKPLPKLWKQLHYNNLYLLFVLLVGLYHSFALCLMTYFIKYSMVVTYSRKPQRLDMIIILALCCIEMFYNNTFILQLLFHILILIVPLKLQITVEGTEVITIEDELMPFDIYGYLRKMPWNVTQHLLQKGQKYIGGAGEQRTDLMQIGGYLSDAFVGNKNRFWSGVSTWYNFTYPVKDHLTNVFKYTMPFKQRFCNSNFQCTTVALCARQFAAKVKPSPYWMQQLKQFMSFYDNVNISMKKKISIQDYIDQIDIPTKRLNLQVMWDNLQLKQKAVNIFTIFAKRFETGLAQPKPRNICNPSTSVKVLQGWLNFVFIKSIKKYFPGFIQGMNADQIDERMANLINHVSNPHFVSYDCSAWDSHQHVSLRVVVEDYWLNKLMQVPEFPVYVYDMIIKLFGSYYVQKLIFSRKIPHTNKDVVIAFFKMKGLTGSGFPLTTTLFNTMRNLMIAHFMCFKAGASKPVGRYKDSWISGDHAVAAAGDDCMITIDEQFYSKLVVVIKSLTLLEEPQYVQEFGMGQVIKVIFYSRFYFSFLSKSFFYYQNTVSSYPLIMKLIYRGSMCDIKNNIEEINSAVSHNLQYENDTTLGVNLIKLREEILVHADQYEEIKWRMEHQRYHDRYDMEFMFNNNALALIHDITHPGAQRIALSLEDGYVMGQLPTVDGGIMTQIPQVGYCSNDLNQAQYLSSLDNLSDVSHFILKMERKNNKQKSSQKKGRRPKDQALGKQLQKLKNQQEQLAHDVNLPYDYTYPQLVNRMNSRWRDPMNYSSVPNFNVSNARIGALYEKKFGGGQFPNLSRRDQKKFDELALADDPFSYQMQQPTVRAPLNPFGEFRGPIPMAGYDPRASYDYWQSINNGTARPGGGSGRQNQDESFPVTRIGPQISGKEGQSEMQSASHASQSNAALIRNNCGYNSKLSAFGAVDSKTIAMLINPTSVLTRVPFLSSEKVAVAQARVSYTITVNASGNGAVTMTPQWVNATTLITSSGAWCAVANNVAFDPVQGTNNALPWTGFNSPLNGSTAINKLQVMSYEVSVIGIAAAVNNSGTVQMAYFTKTPGPDCNGQQLTTVPATGVFINPYYQAKSVANLSNESMRQVMIVDPTDVAWYINMPSNGQQDSIYLLITGASPSSNPIRLDITVNYAYIPTLQQYQLVDVQYPPPAQAGSANFYQGMLKSFPQITQCSKGSINTLTTELICSESVDYTYLWDIISANSGNLVLENAVVAVNPQGGGGGNEPMLIQATR